MRKVATSCLMVTLAVCASLIAQPPTGNYTQPYDFSVTSWTEKLYGGDTGSDGNEFSAMGDSFSLSGLVLDGDRTIVLPFGSRKRIVRTTYTGGKLILGKTGPWGTEFFLSVAKATSIATRTYSDRTRSNLTNLSFELDLYADFGLRSFPGEFPGFPEGFPEYPDEDPGCIAVVSFSYSGLPSYSDGEVPALGDVYMDQASISIRCLTKQLSEACAEPVESDFERWNDLAIPAGSAERRFYCFQSTYDFSGGPSFVAVEDTVSSDWSVLDGYSRRLRDNPLIWGSNLRNNGQGATQILWRPETDGPDSHLFSLVSRWQPDCHCDGTGRWGRHDCCAPTTCGPLEMSGEALAYGADRGLPLPLVASNSLCVALVMDLNGGGIDPSGLGDEDGDGFSDWMEACYWGTNPCEWNAEGSSIPPVDLSPPPPVRAYPIPR